jgi:hypothetical protein
MLDDKQIDEVAVSDAQRDFFNLVLKCKTEGDCPSKKIKKAAEGMTKKQIEDFAHTKGKLPEKVKEESISENKIVSLIKDKENPRMTKKDLIEYVKSKKVVKKIKKEDMIFEAIRRDTNIVDHARWFEPRERRILNAYLLKLRDSGLENMFGVAPILNWTKDDLQRYLYGKRMDLESLDRELYDGDEDYDQYDDEEETNLDNSGRIKRLIDIITYLLDNKQEIRDILVRAALRKAEADGGDYSDSKITRYFHQAASDALLMYMKSFG